MCPRRPGLVEHVIQAVLTSPRGREYFCLVLTYNKAMQSISFSHVLTLVVLKITVLPELCRKLPETRKNAYSLYSLCICPPLGKVNQCK